MSKSKKTVAILALLLLSMVGGMRHIGSVVIAYIMNSYPDLSTTTVQQILSIPSLFGLITAFLVGPLSIKMSKKLLLIISSSLLVAFFAIFALVGGNGPFWLLLFAAALSGTSPGAMQAMIPSVIKDYAGEECGTFIAMSTAMNSIGSIVINSIGGTLAAGNGGANWPYAYTLGLISIPIIIIFAILAPKRSEAEVAALELQKHGKVEKEKPAGFKDIPVRVYLIILMNVVFMFAIAAYMYNMSAYVITEKQLGTSVEVGFASTLGTICSMIAGFTYKFWHKLLKNWSGVIALGLYALGFIIVTSVTGTIYGVYIGGALLGFGMNYANPFSMAKIMEIAPAKYSTFVMSLFFTAVNASAFVGLYIVNFMGNLFGGGFHGALVGGCVMIIIAVVMSVFLYPLGDKKASAVVE